MDCAALPRGALEDLAERADEARVGVRDGEPSGDLAQSSSMSAPRLDAMTLTWSLEGLDTPIFSATLCTLRVLVPVSYISATAG